MKEMRQVQRNFSLHTKLNRCAANSTEELKLAVMLIIIIIIIVENGNESGKYQVNCVRMPCELVHHLFL